MNSTLQVETYHLPVVRPVTPAPDFMFIPLPLLWCAMALNASAWSVAMLTKGIQAPVSVAPPVLPLSFA